MMDSQENAPMIGNAVSPSEELGNSEVMNEEVASQPVEETAEEEASQVETPRKVYETKAEILERIRDIAHGDESPQKDEVDYLKTAFYKLHIAEREASFKAYLDGGGDPEQYQITRNYREDQVDDYHSRRGQQGLSGVQGLAAAVARD